MEQATDRPHSRYPQVYPIVRIDTPIDQTDPTSRITVVKVVASQVDIAVTGRSTVYFADAVHRTIGYIDEQGRTRTLYDGGEIAMPSGLALSPDQAMLIVTEERLKTLTVRFILRAPLWFSFARRTDEWQES